VHISIKKQRVETNKQNGTESANRSQTQTVKKRKSLKKAKKKTKKTSGLEQNKQQQA